VYEGLPSEVVVGAMRFRIVVGKLRGKMGETDFETQVITIVPGQGHDVVRMTLVHEIMHCIFYQSGVDVSSELEEQIIRTIEPFIYMVIRSPDVISFLVGEQ
jgi:hypothetical protein